MARTKSIIRDVIRISLPLLILAGGGLACFAIVASRKPPERIKHEANIPSVQTTAVEKYDGPVDIEVSGLVTPHRDIPLSAEVSGRITFKAEECRAGHFVTKGTLLVEIDRRRYELEVERLEKEVAQAIASVGELDVEIRSAQTMVDLAAEQTELQLRQLQRIEQLKLQNATSAAEVDNARQSELTSRNALANMRNQKRLLETRKDRMEAAIGVTQAKLESAKLDLQYTEIRAPIDGMVVSESVEQNAFVQPGSALLTIEDTSAIEVRCHLRMDELSWLWLQDTPEKENSSALQNDYQLPAAPVTVAWELKGQMFEWDGVLSRYEGIGIDERTRTVPCRVLVTNPRDVHLRGDVSPGLAATPRALVRGMYVHVTIHAQPEVELLRLPSQAVQPGNVVWRVKDGTLNRVALGQVRISGKDVLVPPHATSLRVGDAVITSPLANATEGLEVTLRKEAPVLADEESAAETEKNSATNASEKDVVSDAAEANVEISRR